MTLLYVLDGLQVQDRCCWLAQLMSMICCMYLASCGSEGRTHTDASLRSVFPSCSAVFGRGIERVVPADFGLSDTGQTMIEAKRLLESCNM
jgi:hypothetical protein